MESSLASADIAHLNAVLSQPHLAANNERLAGCARAVYHVCKSQMRAYSHRYSPKKFTQPQLAALIFLKNLRGVSYREVLAIVGASPEIMGALELRRLPSYATLHYAEKRLGRAVARIA